MVKVDGTTPAPASELPEYWLDQCLLPQPVECEGAHGGFLARTTFIQRQNTAGGAVPTSTCAVG
jgi:hypothetical protein